VAEGGFRVGWNRGSGRPLAEAGAAREARGVIGADGAAGPGSAPSAWVRQCPPGSVRSPPPAPPRERRAARRARRDGPGHGHVSASPRASLRTREPTERYHRERAPISPEMPAGPVSMAAARGSGRHARPGRVRPGRVRPGRFRSGRDRPGRVRPRGGGRVPDVWRTGPLVATITALLLAAAGAFYLAGHGPDHAPARPPCCARTSSAPPSPRTTAACRPRPARACQHAPAPRRSG